MSIFQFKMSVLAHHTELDSASLSDMLTSFKPCSVLAISWHIAAYSSEKYGAIFLLTVQLRS